MDQPARLESALGQVVGHSERELETVIDVKRIKDPRLRTMLGLDTRAFDRALSAGDARLALVHLYSIFEAGVLDHALNRRGELGLHGNVESWSLEGILQKALGDRLAIADRALLIGLISGRSLVRPAIQLVSPLAVTAVSLKDSMALVRRIFIELGLIGSGQPDGAKLALSTPGSQPQPLPNPQALHSAGSGWSGIHKAQGS